MRTRHSAAHRLPERQRAAAVQAHAMSSDELEYKPWLQYADRTYGFTPENLARQLGLHGERVIRVEFKDGIWDITVREKEPDA